MSNIKFPRSRYICSVLDEMRKCNETKNYAVLPSLIEEAQIGANRMESALEDYNNLDEGWEMDRVEEQLKDLKKERRKLRAEVSGLKKKSMNQEVYK